MHRGKWTITAMAGFALAVAAVLRVAKGSDRVLVFEGRDPGLVPFAVAAIDYGDVRSVLEGFFAAVESGSLDQATERFLAPPSSEEGSGLGPVDVDGLEGLQKRLIDYRDILPGPVTDSATIYGDATDALAVIPFYDRNGGAEAMCVRMIAGDGWRVSSRESVSSPEALARLKAFREQHPSARGIPRDWSQPRNRDESSLDLAAWEVATKQAIDYARAHPVEPGFGRPPGLANLTPDDDLEEVVRENAARLSHADNEQRRDAQWNLEYLGPPATDACLAALDSEDEDTRQWAVSALRCSHMGTMSDRTLEALVAILTDEFEPSVRQAAVLSLHGLPSARALPVLVEHAIKDPDSSVRATAIQQLADRRDPRAFAPLAELLKREPEPSQRQTICNALMAVDDRAAWPLIIEQAERAEDEHDRFQLLSCAGQCAGNQGSGMPDWPEELAELYRLVRNAYTIQGERYGPSEVEQILGHIDSENQSVRYQCISALSYLRATTAVPELLRIAEQPDMVYVCFRPLAAMGTPEAVEFVARSIRDADRDRRGSLLNTLVDGSPGRWAVPLLIVLLDDRGLLHEAFGPTEGVTPFDYDHHRAHTALVGVCRGLGMETKMRNIAADRDWDLQEEIRGLKAWWAEYGEQFLREEPVPTPQLTMVFWSS